MNRSMSRYPLVTWLQPGETPHIYELVKICFTSHLNVDIV
jgi:hypothetical protein